MGLKKRSLRVLLLLIGIPVLVLLLAAWGATGHRIINSNAIVHLPPSMQMFIQHVGFLSAHASDADGRKGGDSQKPFILKEGPKHFIDIDSYPEFMSKSVPTNFSTLIAKYDSSTVFDIGINPWAAVWTLDSLTAQLKRGDTLDMWQTAADLGHYVGDAHQPLHNTKDYDGRSSVPGSNGIHSRYETGMINAYQSQLTIQPDSVHYISNPIDFAFALAYQSNSYVDSIYAADVYARQTSGWNGSGSAPTSYTDTLWGKTKSFTRLQFQRATEKFADLLYTAWVNSGSGNVTSVPSLASSSVQPEGIWLGQNYPNPFNPSTTISFRLSDPSHVTLTVFNVQGKQIALLMDRTLSAGLYESKFDANTSNLSSGIYICRLRVQSGQSTRILTNKMLLLK
jgi:hypothetical protein